MQPNSKTYFALLTAISLIFAFSFVPLNALAGELVVMIEGVRSLNVGTDTVNFGSLTTSVHDQVITGANFGSLGMVIDDTEPGIASWSVTVAANDFTGDAGTIPYRNIGIIGDNDGIVEVTDGVPDTSGIEVLNSYTQFSGDGEMSDDITLIAADSRLRSSEYAIHPEMKLTVPGGTLAGNYSNTLTITFLVN